MKYYSIGETSRYNTVIIIAIVAIVLANIAAQYDYLLPYYTVDEGWFGYKGLSVTLFGALFWVIDKYIWKIPIIRDFLGLPDLNGIWIGSLARTEYPSLTKEEGLPILLDVKQSYTRISIRLENYDPESASGITHSDAKTISIEGNIDTGYSLDHMFTFEQGYGVSSLKLDATEKISTMSGEYVSSFPRCGRIELRKLTGEDRFARLTVKTLQSEDGEPYLAIPVDAALISDYRRKLGRRMEYKQYNQALLNREERDGKIHHITIVPPQEYKTLDADAIGSIEGKPVALALTGLGEVKRNDAQCCFVTVFSPHAALLRTRVGLGRQDFHVTLGFHPHDIHDHPKDPTTWFK